MDPQGTGIFPLIRKYPLVFLHLIGVVCTGRGPNSFTTIRYVDFYITFLVYSGANTHPILEEHSCSEGTQGARQSMGPPQGGRRDARQMLGW